MSNSLLMVVQNTPQTAEPLPAYRRDPETSSIRSSAPSYVSEAPTYHSTLPAAPPAASRTQRVGLPPANYAQGFNHLRGVDRNGLSHLNFSINQWSSVYSSPQARHYHNVAARRTNLAMIEEQNLLAALSNQTIFPVTVAPKPSNEPTTSTAAQTAASAASQSQTDTSITASPSSPTTRADATTIGSSSSSSSSAAPPPATLPSATEPLSPLEDPDLVGHAAATLARERRLYIAREMQSRRQQEEREALAIREESRRWDFLISQMADWEERERGWKGFSKKLEAKNNRSSARKVLFRFWK